MAPSRNDSKNARRSAGSHKNPTDSDFSQTIEHGPELVLPMHGGPVPLDEDTVALRSEVHDPLEKILRRGRRAGSTRAGVTAFDIIVLTLSWPSRSHTFLTGDQQPVDRQGTTSTGWPARRRHHFRGARDCSNQVSPHSHCGSPGRG